jgi:hypothetical protein
MSYLSDTLTVGVLLVLLFGSIALYLYTRIQQAEQKIHLLESILLDLKMGSEIQSYTELPADIETNKGPSSPSHSQSNTQATVMESTKTDTYTPFEDVKEESVEEYTSLDDAIQESSLEHSISINEEPLETEIKVVDYESMKLKELQTLAKSRGISGAGSMKKDPLIEALKTSDRIVVKPGSTGMSGVGSSSFLETSALVSDESL